MATRKQLNEFKSDDKQSFVPEPVGGKAPARGADQGGELPGKDSPTKVQAISNAVSALAQFSTKEIDDYVANLSKDKNKRSADQSGELPGVVAPTTVKPYAVQREDIADVFADLELSEDAINRMFDLFEAAVNIKLTTEVARLEEEKETELLEAVEEIRAELSEDVDTYLTHVAEEWMAANEVAVESNLKVQIAENLIETLSGVLAEHQIVLPEKVDVVDDLTSKLDESNRKLADALAQIKEQNEEIVQLQIAEAFADMVEGLPLSVIEKLSALAENIEYSDVDEFVSKFQTIQEVALGTEKREKSDSDILSEQFLGEVDGDKSNFKETSPVTDTVRGYASAISRQAKIIS
jgi:hypothetical protein